MSFSSVCILFLLFCSFILLVKLLISERVTEDDIRRLMSLLFSDTYHVRQLHSVLVGFIATDSSPSASSSHADDVIERCLVPIWKVCLLIVLIDYIIHCLGPFFICQERSDSTAGCV
jgi:hypothetical protein